MQPMKDGVRFATLLDPSKLTFAICELDEERIGKQFLRSKVTLQMYLNLALKAS